jgi:DNA-directed RNA polymerase specialized sigma24 family protein
VLAESSLMNDRSGQRRGKWVLSHEAFEVLLARLGDDRDRAGYRYEALRHRLARFFEWRGCPFPEATADEALNRLARRLAEGEEIHDLECYALGVARLLVRESSKAAKRELEAYDAAARTLGQADPSLERLDRCVEACLDELPPAAREIIVEYYSADKHEKIVRRRELAARLGVSVTGLRLRAFRIRQCLAKCVVRRLDDEVG